MLQFNHCIESFFSSSSFFPLPFTLFKETTCIVFSVGPLLSGGGGGGVLLLLLGGLLLSGITRRVRKLMFLLGSRFFQGPLLSELYSIFIRLCFLSVTLHKLYLVSHLVRNLRHTVI